MIGETLADRYEIIKTTEDSFLTKFVVKDHKAFGKLRTILSVNEQSLDNPNIVEWFNGQIELFTTISSDHVVDFIDRYSAGEILKSPTLVVEEPGMTLADLLARGPIQPLAAQNIVIKILLGVDELHKRGYLHLDIRPETIGVNESATEVKLLSLGNCMLLNSDTMSLEPNTKYGAAECYSPTLKMDRSSDIYSIGILFYEMLCGRDTFAAQFSSIVNAQSELERNTSWTNWHVSEKQLEPLDSSLKDVDQKLVDCVHQMIEKDLDKRYTSASTVINELHSIIGHGASAGLTGSFSADDNSAKKNKFRKRLLVGSLASTAILFSLASSGYYYLNTVSNKKETIAQLKKAIAIAKKRQGVIANFGWKEDENSVAGNAAYNLGVAAYKNKNLPGYLSNVRESIVLYDSVIDTKAPVAMADVADNLQTLVSKAQLFGVDSAPLAIENSTDYEDLDELEEKYASYTAKVEEYSNALRFNSRAAVSGSTEEQINDALATCESLADSCLLSWYEDEAERTALLKPFAMDATEVTVSEFREYVEKNKVTTAAEQRNMSSKVAVPYDEFAIVKVADLNWANAYQEDASNLPVVHVTQKDAADYCKSIQKRLPTEAEWEFAAGGYERNTYPWGQEWDASALYWAGSVQDDSTADSEPVTKDDSIDDPELVSNDNAADASETASIDSSMGDSVLVSNAASAGDSEPASNDTAEVISKDNSELVSKVLPKVDSQYIAVKAVGSFPPTKLGIYDLAGGVSEWTSSKDESGESAYIKGASRFDTNIANIRIPVRRLEVFDYSGEDVGFRCAEDRSEWPELVNVGNTIE